MSLNKTNNSGTRREDWGTPRDLFAALSEEHNFVIDLAASRENTLCDSFIDETIDLMSERASRYLRSAVGADLPPNPYAWINPPYKGGGGTGDFVLRAVELCVVNELGLVALVPASVGSVWWREAVHSCFDFVIFTRRLTFEGAPATAQFDTALCILGHPNEHWVGTTLTHERLGICYSRFPG